MPDRKQTGRFLIVLVIAAALRLLNLGSQSLTVDEVIETQTATLPAAEIIQLPNSYPPLYHLLRKLWDRLDTSELGPRHFSVLVGLLSIVVMWRLAAAAVDERVALAAAAITTISPLHIYYSQEGRPNILFLLLTACAIYYGWRLVPGATTWERWMLVAVGVAGCYTHYYFSFVLVAIGVGAFCRQGPKSFWRLVLPPALAIGLVCLPLVLLVQSDFTYQRDLRSPRPASLAALGYTLFSFESGYTLGPSRSQLHTISTREAAQAALPWLLLVGLYVLPTGARGVLFLAERGQLAYWLSAVLVPLLLTVLACRLLGLTFNSRFLLCCWVPYAIVMACGIMAMATRSRLIFGTVMFVVAGMAVYHHHHDPAYANEDIRSAARYIQQFEPRPIVVCAGYMHDVVNHYLQHRDDAAQPHVRRLKDRAHSEGSTAEVLKTVAALAGQKFWFIYSRAYDGDPAGEILQELSSRYGLQPVFEAPGVVVYTGQ